MPRPSVSKQLNAIKKLLGEATVVIHAGDPDREGQLLVDEVLEYLALARSRADWLYGINMTRAYTLLGRNAGYNGVLSVGRVQTPVLGLVVRRDEEIENFVAKDYFEVKAHIVTPADEHFVALWQPSESCEPYQDKEGRLLHRSLAEHVVKRIAGQPATVTDYSDKRESETAPLPYSLSTLPIEAAKRFGLSAQQVLDTCQRLYETHKLITYPCSDCRYLPEEHFAGRHAVINAITVHASGLLPLPVLAKGDVLLCEKGEVVERQTQPPRPFTDATLLSAMTGIARFVQDKTLKKILRETDGLGTEATCAGIIELLFKRSFLFKKGRYIHASEAGRALIHALPSSAALPDMTANWEATLTLISEKQRRYQDFMQPLTETLSGLIEQARQNRSASAFRGLQAPQKTQKKTRKPTAKKAAKEQNG